MGRYRTKSQDNPAASENEMLKIRFLDLCGSQRPYYHAMLGSGHPRVRRFVDGMDRYGDDHTNDTMKVALLFLLTLIQRDALEGQMQERISNGVLGSLKPALESVIQANVMTDIAHISPADSMLKAVALSFRETAQKELAALAQKANKPVQPRSRPLRTARVPILVDGWGRTLS